MINKILKSLLFLLALSSVSGLVQSTTKQTQKSFDNNLTNILAGSLDIDGNNQYDALTDGLLILRNMFGLDGSSLIAGAVASNAIYSSPEQIVGRISDLGEQLDIDGDGQTDALTDGLLILRFLFGLEGEALVNGVISNNATLNNDEILVYLSNLTPAPPQVTISIESGDLYVNDDITIEWTSKNATSCFAGGEWVGEKSLSGQETFKVVSSGILSFRLTCSSNIQTATAETSVSVNPINLTGKYSYENGSHIYIESEKENIFNLPLSWIYSFRKHSGYTYGNSPSGEPIIFGAGWYGNMVLTCRNANLNGDEYPDLVTQSTSGWQAGNNVDETDFINPERRPRVHFYINQGDGFFVDGIELLDVNDDYFRIHTYKDIFIADLNNDGLDDIMTGTGGGGGRLEEVVDDGVLLLMSNSEGKYEDRTDLISHPRINKDRGTFTEDVLGLAGTDTFVAADVNNDGWKDLVTFATANQEERGLYPLVHLNIDGKSFEPWENFENGLEPFTSAEWNSTRGSMVADYDQDGDDDIFVLCYGECFYRKNANEIGGQTPLFSEERNNGFVMINNDGNFFRSEIVHFPPGIHGSVNKNDAIAVGDINGDNLPDVVISQGKINPYYVDRDLQILINTGDGFVDETQSRIENLRNEYNGHAEGHTYLIDFDSDGDLDIFDFQANVVDGYSVSNNNAPSDEDTRFPYWRWGGALFLNNGSGKFVFADEDISNTGELTNLYESWKLATFNEPGHQCPVDFGAGFGYGIGFEGNSGEIAENINPPPGEEFEDYSTQGFSVGRKLNVRDNFRRNN